MDTFLAICQGLGLALAIGAGGVLAALFVATMAHVDLGIDVDGTDWEFLASNWFVAVLFGLNVAAFAARRSELLKPVSLVLLSILGALYFAASLAEEGISDLPGLAAGLLAAALAFQVASGVLEGARRRAAAGSDQQAAADAAGTLALIFAFGAIAAAAAALFAPPTAIALLIGLLVLGAGRRRRADEKYEGLRILR